MNPPEVSRKTLVVGVTDNPTRYAYRAVDNLLQNGHEVVALGPREGETLGLPILTGKPQLEGIDTITMYINPLRQEPMMDYLLSLKPRRILFNPGTENPDFAKRANALGIETEEACTLVLLSIQAY